MSIVKIDALSALRCAIADAVPEVGNNICVGIGAPGHKLAFPSIAIDPFSFRYRPMQASEVESLVDSVVMDVGFHEVNLQLRITAKSSSERYRIEQQVTNLFLSQPLTPGVLVTKISGCTRLSQYAATWILDRFEWEDGKAFDQIYEAVVTVTGEIPALVTRVDTYTIKNIQLGLTDDFTAAVPAPLVATEKFDVVAIEADGSLTEVTL